MAQATSQASSAGATAEQEHTEEEIAAAIAILLAGGAPETALVALLLRFVSGDLKRADRQEIARKTARLIVSALPEAPIRPGETQRAALEDSYLRRAHYALQAQNRLEANISGSREEWEKALDAEARYFALHQHKNDRAMRSAKVVDAAMEAYGRTLGWYSVIRPTSRPNHARAHAHNFIAGTIPRETEALPGVLAGCLCAVGPPIPGAKLIT